MANTIITGASGFLGQHLTEFLKPAPLVLLERKNLDLLDTKKLRKVIEDNHPSVIYHLAGHSRVNETTSFEDYFSKNFLTTQSLAECLVDYQKPLKIFFASSVHVYGNQKETVKEDSDIHPLHPYGFTKYLAEQALVELSKKNSNIKVVVGRFFNCIGPGQSEGFVVTDLCKKIKASSVNEIVVKNLHAKRRFLDVRDAVKILPELIQKCEKSFEIFNIAGENDLQISEVVEKLIHISGKKLKAISQEDSKHNPFSGLQVSTQKLKGAFTHSFLRPIEETLHDMYNDSLCQSKT